MNKTTIVVIVVLVLLLLANGIYTYTLQSKLHETEAAMKQLGQQLEQDFDDLDAAVDELQVDIYGRKPSVGAIYQLKRDGLKTRVDDLEQSVEAIQDELDSFHY